MRNAIFTVCWMGVFRPIKIEPGACVLLDTGRVTAGKHWHRCVASFKFDGETVTMARFTEVNDSAGYLSSRGSWTCPLGQLNTEARDLGGVTILTPDWIDDDARVYQQAASA